ncbi:hypothetical protein ACFL54_09510 [Planctomycetota bacterium]
MNHNKIVIFVLVTVFLWLTATPVVFAGDRVAVKTPMDGTIGKFRVVVENINKKYGSLSYTVVCGGIILWKGRYEQ